MISQINAKFSDTKFPIIISDKAIDQFSLYLSNFNSKNIVLVVDEIFKRKEFHPNKIFSKILSKYNVYFMKAGIKNKDIKNAIKIINYLNTKKISKDGLIVAIGGGVVGDIAGFCSSIYKRGIKLTHLPTTMTSFVDSCIGGKTGINHFNQVNFLGTYHQPDSVFIDLRFLKTLNSRDYKSGIVESIKKAIISEKLFFNFINNNYRNILELKFEYVQELILKSINSKIYFASQDVKENYLRLFLNYGHTFGQAIESFYKINESKLTHGEAVSLGMISASKMQSLLTGDKLIIKEHKEILNKYNLPIKISDIKKLKKPNINNLILNLQNDKKKTFHNIRFILCSKIGSPYIFKTSDKRLIKKSFNQIIK